MECSSYLPAASPACALMASIDTEAEEAALLAAAQLQAEQETEHGAQEVFDQRPVPGYTHQLFGEMSTPGRWNANFSCSTPTAAEAFPFAGVNGDRSAAPQMLDTSSCSDCETSAMTWSYCPTLQGRVLSVVMHQVKHPVPIDVLNHLFSVYGVVETIFQSLNQHGRKVLIQYQHDYMADNALRATHGWYLYSTYCQLDVGHAYPAELQILYDYSCAFLAEINTSEQKLTHEVAMPQVEAIDDLCSVIPPLKGNNSEQQPHVIQQLLAQAKAQLETISEKLRHAIVQNSRGTIWDCIENNDASKLLLAREAIKEFQEMPMSDDYDEGTKSLPNEVIFLSENTIEQQKNEDQRPIYDDDETEGDLNESVCVFASHTEKQPYEEDDQRACSCPVLKASNSCVMRFSQFSIVPNVIELRLLWDPGATKFPVLFMTVADATKLQRTDGYKFGLVHRIAVQFGEKRELIFESAIMCSCAFGFGWTEVNAAAVLVLLVPCPKDTTTLQVTEQSHPLEFSFMVAILPNEGEFRDEQLVYMCQGTSSNFSERVKHMLFSCCLPSFEMAKLQWDPGIALFSYMCSWLVSGTKKHETGNALVCLRNSFLDDLHYQLQMSITSAWNSGILDHMAVMLDKTAVANLVHSIQTNFELFSSMQPAQLKQFCTQFLFQYHLWYNEQNVFLEGLHAHKTQLLDCSSTTPNVIRSFENAYTIDSLLDHWEFFHQLCVQKDYNAKNLLSPQNYLQLWEMDIIFITYLPP